MFFFGGDDYLQLIWGSTKKTLFILVDIALLTEKRYLVSSSDNPYVQNIVEEDGLVQIELEKLGLSCQRVAWDNNFDESLFKFALFRTTWNYFDKLDDFYVFLKRASSVLGFINPIGQIMWNLNKKYLLELRDSGVNIPESHIVRSKESASLSSVASLYGWNDIVIKPCVSAAAWNTHRIKRCDFKKSEALFAKLLINNDMLVQSFQKNILLFGEISIMIIGGEYSHAVLKKAKPGDYRVQDDFGGTVHLYEPRKPELDFARQVILSLPFSPVYARIDIILDNAGKIALSELELIEPEMWFRFKNSAPQRLARAILLHTSK